MHWTFACKHGQTDYLVDLDMESTYILADSNHKNYNDKMVMRATDDAHLKMRQDSLLAQNFRNIVWQFINAMVAAFIRPGVNSTE